MRKENILTACVVLGWGLIGTAPCALAQNLPGTPQVAADMQYANDILAKLGNCDVADIEHNLANDFVVATLLRTIDEKGTEDRECLLTEPSRYWGYFKYSMYVLQKKLGSRESVYGHLIIPFVAKEFVNYNGCKSCQVQSSLNNGIRYALGAQEPVPYDLDKESIFPIRFSSIDRYCKSPGRYDPACSNLIGFLIGRDNPSCFEGLNIPAAPTPPKVVRCDYSMPISEETRRNFNRVHRYWYQRVPDNLNSLHVYGIDQFSAIAPVAVEACPKDFRKAAKLSGDRYGLPISSLPGEETGIPDPPASRAVPRCKVPPVIPPTEAPIKNRRGGG